MTTVCHLSSSRQSQSAVEATNMLTLLRSADGRRRAAATALVAHRRWFAAVGSGLNPNNSSNAWVNPANVPPGESLRKFGRDLTESARDGKLDPVIGREEQIRRAVQILSRRTKNNPVLIGEPGVGKTAIAEGLAQRIALGTFMYTLYRRLVWLGCIGSHRLSVLRRSARKH